MKKLLAALLLLPALANAAGAALDIKTNVLTLPTLTIGTDTFTNVKVRLDAITLIAVDPLATGIPAGTVCTDANFTNALLAKLRSMNGQAVTLKQLEEIVGCSVTTVLPSGDVFLFKSATTASKAIMVMATNGILDTSTGLPLGFN